MNSLSKTKKTILNIVLFLSLFTVIFLWGNGVFAQSATDTFGLNTFGQASELGTTTDIRIIIGRIVRAVLGVLGIIVVGIVLYGGYRYMTSEGNEEQVGQAKRIIVNGVIGLAIILASFTIVQFVLGRLYAAINLSGRSLSAQCQAWRSENPINPLYFSQCAGTPGSQDCSTNPLWCCSASNFVVKSITPRTDGTGMNNVNIRAIFSRPLSNTPQGALTVYRDGADVTNEFIFNFIDSNNSVIESTHVATSTCTPGNCIRRGDYRVVVNPDVRDLSGNRLTTNATCGTFPTEARFTVDYDGALDSEAPAVSGVSVNGLVSNNHQLIKGQSHQISLTITDNTGVGYVRLEVLLASSTQPFLVYYDAPPISVGSNTDLNPYVFQYPLFLPDAITALQPHGINIRVVDIDGNATTVSTTFFAIANTCNNGFQDGDETGVDTGGSCPGVGACSQNGQCTSLMCVSGRCVNAPLITGVDPWDGAEDNFLTVSGRNFGTRVGSVQFAPDTNNDGQIDDGDSWVDAQVVNCAGIGSWNDNYIVVSVPRDVDLPLGSTSSIRVIRSDDTPSTTLRDTTTDSRGPVGLFTKNTISRPGLCNVATRVGGLTQARPGTEVLASGRGFGNVATQGTITFGGVQAGSLNWTDQSILTEVPANMSDGAVAVRVSVDSGNGPIQSNGVRFVVGGFTSELSPIIESISPSSTTGGSLVTIKGQRFGDLVGRGVFISRTPQQCLRGSSGCVAMQTVFPQCGNSWTDNRVVAQVPLGMAPGLYYVTLVDTADRATPGTDIFFEVVPGSPRPGICSLDPAGGPAPLLDPQKLVIGGINFDANSIVNFWQLGADATNLSTWLQASGRQILVQNNQITTNIPVNPNTGYSMPSGPSPIIVSNVLQSSNPFDYTVEDCRASSSTPAGYQCCAQGPDAGFLRPNAYVCVGEVRDAGYMWRFTTGKIPNIPYVVESCDPSTPSIMPSPSPREVGVGRSTDQNVCLNARLGLRFSADMDSNSVLSGVKIVTCGNGDVPNCNPGTDVTPQFRIAYQSRALVMDAQPSGTNLNPNTWYRVELADTLQSQEQQLVFGNSITINEPLRSSASCGPGTAYCYAFKTNPNIGPNGQCQLVNAFLQPPNFTTNILGVVQDSRFPIDLQNPNNPPFPLYYYVWGSGDRECSILNVDGLGWSWDTTNSAKATARVTPDQSRYTDSRAIATAIEDTAGIPVDVRAQLSGVRVNAGPVDLLQSSLGNSAAVSVRTPQEVRVLPDPQGIYSFNGPSAAMTIGFMLDPLPDPSTLTIPEVVNNYDFVVTTTNASGQVILQSANKLRYLLSKNNHYDFYVSEIRYPNGSGQRTTFFTIFLQGGVNVNLFDSYFSNDPWWNQEVQYKIAKEANGWVLYRNNVQIHQASGNLNTQPRSLSGDITIGGRRNGPSSFYLLDGDITGLVLDSSGGVQISGQQLTTTSSLIIDLGDPEVNGYWPGCSESCTNINIGVSFNRQMNTSTYAGGVSVRRCLDPLCTQLAETIPVSSVDGPLTLDPTIYRLTPNTALATGTWYLVSVSSSIKSKTVLSTSGNSLAPFQWKFRTKSGDGLCIIENVRVLPDPFRASLIGQKTQYKVLPYSSPDQCSRFGQELNPWGYGWDWTTQNLSVAVTTNFTTVAQPKPFCGLGCLPSGSDYEVGVNKILCGDGVVSPNEDCDIGATGVSSSDGSTFNERIGVSCSFSCLRPGNNNFGVAIGQCGNGIVEEQFGEECDLGGDPNTWVGCARDCLNTGSLSIDEVGTSPGVSACNDSAVTTGEECEIDDGLNPYCDDKCLRTGVNEVSSGWCALNASVPFGNQIVRQTDACYTSVSVCGNNLVEPGEECEIINTNPDGSGDIRVPGSPNLVAVNDVSVCSKVCILDGDICAETNIPSNLRCQKGSEGCSSECTLLGSSIYYSNSSLCGDGIVGSGESNLCEYTPAEVAQATAIGQDPRQVVTAVGQGPVDPFNRSQSTTVDVTAVAVRGVNGVVNNFSPTEQAIGMGEYTLQCGNVEFDTKDPRRVVNTGGSNSVTIENNCPTNLTNALDPALPDNVEGVGNNSCCYLRGERVSEYPVDGSGFPGLTSGPVCRNTYIEVTFNRDIDPQSVDNNSIFIARGSVSGGCSSDEFSVNSLVNSTLVFGGEFDSNSRSLWFRIWDSVKTFFARLFGYSGAQASDYNPSQVTDWCRSNALYLIPQIKYNQDASGTVVSTTVALYLSQALDPDTYYAVTIVGGKNGIKDVNGVGIRPPLSSLSTNSIDDSWVFRTNPGELCRVASVDLDPESHLFTVPNTSTLFTAVALEQRGNPIVSIPNVYEWEWAWGPQNHPVFAIPFSGNPSIFTTSTIGSRSVEGRAVAFANATVVNDVLSGSVGQIYPANADLIADFCENPWPSRQYYPYEEGVVFGSTLNQSGTDARGSFDGSILRPVDVDFDPNVTNGQYFNFSMGYCADAGFSGDTSDDLPYLRPTVIGDLVNPGICTGGLPSGGSTCFGDNDCSSGTCQWVGPSTQSTGILQNTALKRFVFFNNTNDDVIGIQIFRNPERLDAETWYKLSFPSSDANLQLVGIDGYRGVSDGSNIYIDALNLGSDGQIYNNIYLFSINDSAEDSTREVFSELLSSLKFNINISDFGYCSVGDGTDSLLASAGLQDIEIPDPNSSVSCNTDLDCLDVSGSSRVCANARTKLLRDWQRLPDIRQMQSAIDDYSFGPVYPTLESGTYIPGLTNSRWPSWGQQTLSRLVGDQLPIDPINDWSDCGLEDTQTCWDAAATNFVCPDVSHVYAYQYNTTTNDYQIFASLEYLNYSHSIVGEYVSSTHFTNGSFCSPSSVYSPFGQSCGDGVVNIAAGEECDPPGQTVVGNVGGRCSVGLVSQNTCDNQCRWVYGVCSVQSQCGNGITETGEICDDGPLNGTYGHCAGTNSSIPACSGSHEAFCGDGRSNFIDTNTDGYRDTGDNSPEYCEVTDSRFGQGYCQKDSCRYGRFVDGSVNTLLSMQRFLGVHFLDANNGWAVGSQPTTGGILTPAIYGSGYIYKWVNNGWQLAHTEPDSFSFGMDKFSAVHFADVNNGWAVGDRFIFKSSSGGGPGTWIRQLDTLAQLNFSTELFSIFAINEQTVITVGSGGVILRTTDGGNNWNRVSVPIASLGVSLNDVYFSSDQIGWIVGNRGNILRTVDGGVNWLLVASPVSSKLNSVFFVDQQNGWIVGNGGVVLRTTNGGSSWDNIATGFSDNLEDVYFVDAAYGMAVGPNNTLIHSVDGGANWTLDRSSLNSFTNFSAVHMFGSLSAILLGDGVSGGLSQAQSIQVAPDQYCQANTLCTADSQCSYGDVCIVDSIPNYHVNQNNSCSLDCQSGGGYCGDGILQIGQNSTNPYEECDDGNLNNFDGCNRFCQLEPGIVQGSNASSAPSCGNGIRESNEACDLGLLRNGVPCDPLYDASCTYCSEDCRQVLTVDSQAFCGNGRIDVIGKDSRGSDIFEACDINQNGMAVVEDSQGNLVVNQCSDKGSYVCQSNCTQLVNSCISCGTQTILSGGAIPKFVIVNPIADPYYAISTRQWALSNTVTLYRRFVSSGILAGSNYTPLSPATTLSTQNNPFYNEPQPLFTNGSGIPNAVQGLQTNLQCNGEYFIGFNGGSSSSGGFGGIGPQIGSSPGSIFPYPVDSEAGEVINEYVLSPAMPRNLLGIGPKNMRIVVRWTDREQGAIFTGVLYNQAFAGSGLASAISLPRAISEGEAVRRTLSPASNPVRSDWARVCIEMSQDSAGFWWPTGCTGLAQSSVFVHDIFGSDSGKTYTQAMTVVAGGGSLANQNSLVKPKYAFFVDEITRPIAPYKNNNTLQVEVYEELSSSALSNPPEAFHVPNYVFTIDNAAATSNNPNAEYWHVFNLNYNPRIQRYEMERIGPEGHGFIETDFQGVLGNLGP